PPGTAMRPRCHRSKTWSGSRGGGEKQCTYEKKRRATTSRGDVTQHRRGETSSPRAGLRCCGNSHSRGERARCRARPLADCRLRRDHDVPPPAGGEAQGRSEERRVGKEGRYGW